MLFEDDEPVVEEVLSEGGICCMIGLEECGEETSDLLGVW